MPWGLVDPVSAARLRLQLAAVRQTPAPGRTGEVGEDVRPPVGREGRAHAHDHDVLGGVEQPGVVLHEVEAELGRPRARDVPRAPVAQRTARLHRRRADDGQREERREHGGHAAGERVGGVLALLPERARQREHPAGEEDEGDGGPGIARRRVGREAETGEHEKHDDGGERPPQAQGEERRRPRPRRRRPATAAGAVPPATRRRAGTHRTRRRCRRRSAGPRRRRGAPGPRSSAAAAAPAPA